MDAESQVIHNQMEATRHSLTEKLGTLEQQVTETMHGANQAVNNSLESVKETVATVKDSVHETVATMKDSVQETVATIKESLDLRIQVERHPWALTGASLLVGYLIGSLQPRTAPMAAKMEEASEPVAHAPTWMSHGRAGETTSEFAGNGRTVRAAGSEWDPTTFPAGFPAPAKNHWYSGLAESLKPEMEQLKGMALGTLIGVVRDMVTEAAPEHMRHDLGDIIDHVTVKMGGEPIRNHA